jgi:endoglucanase
MDGGTCNSTAFVAFGYDASGLCLPLGNYHNMTIPGEVGYGCGTTAGPGIATETIDLDDFAGLVRILVSCARRFNRYVPGFGEVRDRLTRLYDTEQRAKLYATSDLNI